MYIMTEIQYMDDDTVAVAPTVTYTDPLDALSAYHSKCASLLASIKAGNIKACLIKTFGEAGADIYDMTAYLKAE